MVPTPPPVSLHYLLAVMFPGLVFRPHRPISWSLEWCLFFWGTSPLPPLVPSLFCLSTWGRRGGRVGLEHCLALSLGMESKQGLLNLHASSAACPMGDAAALAERVLAHKDG